MASEREMAMASDAMTGGATGAAMASDATGAGTVVVRGAGGAADVCGAAAGVCDAGAASAGAVVVCGAAGASVSKENKQLKDLFRLIPPELMWLILSFIDQPSMKDYRTCKHIFLAMRQQNRPMHLPLPLRSNERLMREGHFAYLIRRLVNPQIGQHGDVRTEEKCWLEIVHTANVGGNVPLLLKALRHVSMCPEVVELCCGSYGPSCTTAALLTYYLDNVPTLDDPELICNIGRHVGRIGDRGLARRVLELLQGADREVAIDCCWGLMHAAAFSRKLPLIAGLSGAVTDGKPLIKWLGPSLEPSDVVLFATSFSYVSHVVDTGRRMMDLNPQLEPSVIFGPALELAMEAGMEEMYYELSRISNERGSWSGIWPEDKANLHLITDGIENQPEVVMKLWRLPSETIRSVLSSTAIDAGECFRCAAHAGALNAMWAILKWMRANDVLGEQEVLARSIASAAHGGKLNAIEFCLEQGGTPPDDALEAACVSSLRDNSQAVRMLIEWMGRRGLRFSQEGIWNALGAAIWWNPDADGQCSEAVLKVLLEHFDLADEALAQACNCSCLEGAEIALEFGARCYDQLEEEIGDPSAQFWDMLRGRVTSRGVASEHSERAAAWLAWLRDSE